MPNIIEILYGVMLFLVGILDEFITHVGSTAPVVPALPAMGYVLLNVDQLFTLQGSVIFAVVVFVLMRWGFRSTSMALG